MFHISYEAGFAHVDITNQTEKDVPLLEEKHGTKIYEHKMPCVNRQ